MITLGIRLCEARIYHGIVEDRIMDIHADIKGTYISFSFAFYLQTEQ